MSDTLVSVVIPTFNRETLLRRAVESVLTQTHSDVEILVVDDGSTDGTGAMIQTAYESEPRVRYLRQQNAGVSAARNCGLSVASGAYLAFLDSDDYWYPWKLELQLRCLQRVPDAGMIWSDMDAIGDGGRLLHARYLRRMYSAYDQFKTTDLFSNREDLATTKLGMPPSVESVSLWSGNIFKPMIKGNLVHTSTALLTRKRFEEVRAFREDLKYSGEDYDFHLRTCRAGTVAFVDVPTIAYTVGMADQLTHPSLKIFIAQNSLKTIEPIIAQDSEQGQCLPKQMVRSALAEANAWIGEELMRGGHRAEARSYFLRSLRYQLLSPRTFLLAVATLFPLAMIKVMLATWRNLLHLSDFGSE